MIIIWKLTSSTFRLGIPNSQKFVLQWLQTEIQWLRLNYKQLNMNRSMVWNIVKKSQETGNTLDRPRRERKRSVRSSQLLKNTREKLRRNPRRCCRTLVTATSVSKFTMHQVLRNDLGVKPLKMLHRQELTANHVAMRAQNCKEIL